MLASRLPHHLNSVTTHLFIPHGSWTVRESDQVSGLIKKHCLREVGQMDDPDFTFKIRAIRPLMQG